MASILLSDQTDEAWLYSTGARSVSLLRWTDGSWHLEVSLGEPDAELPWDLLRAGVGSLTLDEDDCARRQELASAGVKAAGLVDLSDGLLAWVTSRRSSWFPSSDLCVALRWLGSSKATSDRADIDHQESSSAGVAHDLRNQLSLALLRLEMVRSQNMDDVSAVRGALRSGRAMCNAFLGADESHEDHLLAGVIEQEVRGAVDSSRLRRVSVAIRCGSKVLVHAPESGLRRFIHNALMNAIEASPDDSKILVEVLSAGPGRIELSIEDSGAGLSSAGVASSFAPRSSGRGSTGLGTSSLREAASALGFPLRVSTGVGAGTRISVHISAARAERPVAVLLDTDPVLSAVTRAELESLGWWVVLERSLDSAVSALDRLSASLCVVRRGAPGGGGQGLRIAAEDLSVPFYELSAAKAECSLPTA